MVTLAIYIVATVVVVIAGIIAFVVALTIVANLLNAFFACVLAFAELVNWLATIAWRLVAWPFRILYRFVARKVAHHAR